MLALPAQAPSHSLQFAAPNARISAARSLVEAELAFDKRAAQEGNDAAFLSVLEDSGILFRPGPVNGKAWVRRQQRDSSRLTWFPSFVEVSESEDLGYSTGPYQWRSDAESKQVSHGHFVSVWGRREGSWKLLLDTGSPHAAPVIESAVFEPGPTKATAIARTPPPFSFEALKDLELEFSNKASASGIVSAYNDYLATGAKFYRAGSQPTSRPEDIQKALERADGIIKWTCLGGAVARSNDLGYSYGTRAYTPDPKAIPKPETMSKHAARLYSFLHIWKRQPSGRWKVILDLENPMP